MKAKWFLLAALGVLAVSCMVKEPEQDVMVTDAPKIVATFGSDGPSTKVSVTESDGQTRQTFWEKGDGIAVFMHNGRALEYALEGDGGESTGIFSYAGGVGGGLDFPGVYGVYPFDKGVGFDGSEVSLTFPAEQNYRADAFDAKANIMVAASQTNELFFRNVGGYLVLKLYGEDVSVSKVTVRGNAGEPLAGPATVWVSETEAPEIEVVWETAEKAVTLVCATPVKVGATEADGTEFWFVLPPTEFEEGLTVTVSDGKGGTFTRSATGWIDLARSEVYRLATEVELEYLNGFEYVEMAPGLKVATKNVGAETPEDIGDYFAWGETSPKEDYINGNYKYGDLYEYNQSKYTLEDGLYELEPEDDAATVNWGEGWHTPNVRVFEWLIDSDHCTWSEATHTDAEGNEVDGLEVVSKISGYEGNTVFFPYSGYRTDNLYGSYYVYLWSSTTSDTYSKASAYNLIDNGYQLNYYRYCGMPIRPIYGDIPVTEVSFKYHDSYLLLKDMHLFLKVDAQPEYASETISFTSSDESVATVNKYGVVLAVGLGDAVITAASESGVTATCTVTVSETPDPSWPLGKQWETPGYLMDFGKTLTDYFIWAESKPEDYIYNNSEVYQFDEYFLTAGGNFGFSYQVGDGRINYYLAELNEESSFDLWEISDIDFTMGEISYYDAHPTYTPVSPAKELTFADVNIKLGSDVYPMWTVDSIVDSHTGFMTGLMGGKTSATLPLQPIVKNGELAYGEQADFEGLDLTGKIAVVSRGSNSFYVKLNYAAEAGAIAVLVVNNVPGRVRPNLTGAAATIPFFIVPKATYDQLLEAVEADFVLTEAPNTEYLQ